MDSSDSVHPHPPLLLTLFGETPDFCTAHRVSMNQLWERGCPSGGLWMLISAELLDLATSRSISTRLQTVWLLILLRSLAVRPGTVQ